MMHSFIVIGLMALFRIDTGSIEQYGRVDSFPDKTTNEAEYAISEAQFAWMIDNCPCKIVDGVLTNYVPAPLPTQLEHGVAVKRDGHWIEFIPHGGDVIAVQISDSPIDSATRDARIAAAVASASSSKSTWRTDMQTFRGSVSTNIADVQAIAALPAGFTAAQNRATVNALRSELIDAFREINQLRKLLRQYAREQAED
jgi:hypothetical protein